MYGDCAGLLEERTTVLTHSHICLLNPTLVQHGVAGFHISGSHLPWGPCVSHWCLTMLVVRWKVAPPQSLVPAQGISCLPLFKKSLQKSWERKQQQQKTLILCPRTLSDSCPDTICSPEPLLCPAPQFYCLLSLACSSGSKLQISKDLEWWGHSPLPQRRAS